MMEPPCHHAAVKPDLVTFPRRCHLIPKGIFFFKRNFFFLIPKGIVYHSSITCDSSSVSKCIVFSCFSKDPTFTNIVSTPSIIPEHHEDDLRLVNSDSLFRCLFHWVFTLFEIRIIVVVLLPISGLPLL